MNNAVIILSGGLDSTTCLAIAKSRGFKCHALTFDYNQKNRAEINASKIICSRMGAESQLIFNLPIDQFKGSSLTDTSMAVPDFNDSSTDEIPSTYVPARNTIFLSIAMGYAETLNANNIFIGVSAIDYSGYPDCRPEYIESFQNMANLATKSGVSGDKLIINTPLIKLSKAETIKAGHSLGVDYSLTVTCYNADEKGRACGKCDSCEYRKKGFSEASIPDPTVYYR